MLLYKRTHEAFRLGDFMREVYIDFLRMIVYNFREFIKLSGIS